MKSGGDSNGTGGITAQVSLW